MSYKIQSIDMSDIEKIAQDLGLADKYCWHDDPAPRLITGLGILKHGLRELEGVSGVHITVVKPDLKRFPDYAFDFRDEDGNEILPFFNEEQPLFCRVVLYNLFRMFPELKLVHTAKIGLCNSDTMRTMCKPFEQKFDTFQLQYDLGFLRKFPLSKKEK